MKKAVGILLAVIMVMSLFTLTSFAADTAVTANVSIIVKGDYKVTVEGIKATDIDGDSVITVNDMLYAAHQEKYPGGAEAGYGYYTSETYGMSLSKLWGDTSGDFGYYLNNESCYTLSTPVNNGDSLTAYIYSDTTLYSDMYTYFDNLTATADSGEEISLTLSGAGFDSSWNPVTVKISGAEITVDGQSTGIVTDAEGKATIKITSGGKHIISAKSATAVLVPPVCVADVTAGADNTEKSPATGDNGGAVLFFAVLSSACVAFLLMFRKKVHEKQ